MKVILRRDVANIGRKYEEKTVSDGYALNYLIPKGLADLATPKALARVKTLQAGEEVERKVKESLLAENMRSLEGAVVEIAGKANDKGHLFAGVHKEALVVELKKQTRLDVMPEFIVLEKPIKEVGEHMIEVKAHDKTAKFKVVISAL